MPLQTHLTVINEKLQFLLITIWFETLNDRKQAQKGNPTMGISERKKQQKLAKKKKKRSLHRSPVVLSGGMKMSIKRMAIQASTMPIFACYASVEQLAVNGMGTIVLARKTRSGVLAVSIVLLDVYCLGVKNADFKALTTEQLPEMMGSISCNEIVEACDPADVKKLINDSIDYAAKLGFKPHADYEIAKILFNEIDESQSNIQFEFGCNGKPFFISGPNDSQAKINNIIKTLNQSCGEGNYEFMISGM